jgi:hypothetical protein
MVLNPRHLVKTRISSAELKSTGQSYYVSSKSGIMGVYSPTPELAWLSAWRHLCSM